MSFTEPEKNQISIILSINPFSLSIVLDRNAAMITAQVETDVRTQLDRWDAEGAKFVRLTSTESNYGVNTDSSEAKDDIRKNIAVLLGLDYMQFAGAGTYLPRS